MDPTRLQATLVDFAIGELVRQHRERFQPLWSTESWAKLMIWLALSCGCSGDEAGLRAFAMALGPPLSGRMRRLFFERELQELELRLMADPAEAQVLVLPLGPAEALADPARLAAALDQVGLTALVETEAHWQRLDAALALPWRRRAEL
ncbi:MAG: protein phosphatase [Cyanobacteriota bacterium]